MLGLECVRAARELRAEREAAIVAKRNLVIAAVVRRLTAEMNSAYAARQYLELAHTKMSFRLSEAHGEISTSCCPF